MRPRHGLKRVLMYIHIRKSLIAVLLLVATFVARPSLAHEFWLEPDNYNPAADAKVVISHNYGQYFKGDGLPYVGEWHQRYVVFDGKKEKSVRGYDGDLPAIETKFDDPGLKIFGYFGTPEPQVYDTLEKYDAYLRKVGLDHIVGQHRALGKPETKIRELYARNAKMLLGVGNAKGADRALGLPLELIAERNPYTLKAGDTLPVRLLYRGKPIAGVRVVTFDTQDPKNPSATVTDAAGRAQIALPASGAYLLNAVHMFEPAPGEETDWTSLWASLTFSVR